MFENKCSCDDSEDNGLCDGDSDLKKDSNSNYKNAEFGVLQRFKIVIVI